MSEKIYRVIMSICMVVITVALLGIWGNTSRVAGTVWTTNAYLDIKDKDTEWRRENLLFMNVRE